MPLPRQAVSVEPPHRPAKSVPGLKAEPGRADHPAAGVLHRENREVVRSRLEPVDQLIGQPAPVFAPDLGFHRRDRAHVGLRRHPAQRDPGRRHRGRRPAPRPSPRARSPASWGTKRAERRRCGRSGGPVMTADLPLHRLAPAGEEIPLCARSARRARPRPPRGPATPSTKPRNWPDAPARPGTVGLHREARCSSRRARSCSS